MGARLLDSLYVSGYGTSAASGTVQFYQPGTLTPVTVYSDDVLVTVYTQPITLDASGKTPLPVYTATPVRAIIKSVAGATLADITRFDGDRAELVQTVNASWPGATTLDGVLTLLGATTGGTDGKYLDSGIGAVARTIQAKFAEIQISVKDYGAVGNGITDDTTAIQSTVTRVAALGGGVVYFPPGTYLTSSTITIASAGVDIIGSGMQASFIKCSGAAQNALTFSAGPFSLVTVNRVSRLGFTHSSTTTGSAIAGNALAVDSVYVVASTYRFGVTASGGLTWSLTNSNIFGITTDASCIPVNITGAIGFVMTGCNIQRPGNGSACVVNATSSDNTLVGNYIDTTPATTADAVRNAGGSIILSGNVMLGSANGVSVTGGSIYGSGNIISGITHAVNIGASGNALFPGGQLYIGDIADARTATTAPVCYTVGTGNVTPLPLQTAAIRIIGNAGGGTVTINAISATGFGFKWSLICSNTSGGAVTWTFNAQYVLSAAVAPATGNRVNLVLEYNPVDNKVYEIGRAATAN